MVIVELCYNVVINGISMEYERDPVDTQQAAFMVLLKQILYLESELQLWYSEFSEKWVGGYSGLPVAFISHSVTEQ